MSKPAPFPENHPLVGLRRDLHAHPELRFTEHRTQQRVREALAELPGGEALEISAVADTGLVVRLPSRQPGPAVLLRADMDAYPVTEATTLPFRSTVAGVAHACGHDIHMTVLVGVIAALLAEAPPAGTVTALFQPAEEIPYGQPSGARTVLNSGQLADRYDAVLGLHCWPELPAGTIGVNSPISMAAKDAFSVTVTGRGAHVAAGSQGRDAILAMATLVQALHATIGRRREAGAMVAFNVGTISGGVSQSLVAESAGITGTLRTQAPEVREQLRTAIEQVTAGIAAAHDVTAELVWADEMPAVINHPDLVAAALELGAHGLPVTELATSPLTADDFALLTGLGPGLYLKLGTAGRSPGDAGNGSSPTPEAAPLHSPLFEADEQCLPSGIRALELLTRQVLAEQVRPPAATTTDPISVAAKDLP